MRNLTAMEPYDAISIGGRDISELRYGDDTVLLSSSAGLRRILENNRLYSKEAGLLINASKTKLMKQNNSNNNVGLTLSGKHLELVDNFEYLGVSIQKNGDGLPKICRKTAMELKTLGQLRRLWKNTDIHTRVKAVKTIVQPSSNIWV